jgi:hypothetical protein
MAGGRRINDHKNWMGSPSKESPLPMQSKMKQETSAEGAGAVMRYEDTTETIKAQQMEGMRKAKAMPMKPNYRG